MSHSRVQRPGVAGRLGTIVVSALLLLVAVSSGSVAGAQPVLVAPFASDFVSTSQIIVRWEGAGPPGSAGEIGAQPAREGLVTAAAGEQATRLRTLAVGGDVYRFGSRLSAERIAAIVATLRAQPGVASVEPDQILKAVASPPNDPFWTSPAPGPPPGQPGQWDLSEGTTTTTFGIDLLGAWDRSLGAGVVVAVLDTGITVHPDLAGQTVAGFDFVSDVPTANDGNGRDADPSDPGDWITASENFAGFFAGCGASSSSWHGTHVSGTIAAVTNNAVGIAGIAPSAKIQPVRVLGKCGGFNSDISDGIVWASGGPVVGVPANATPARVINMSLGGSGPCPSSMQTAITSALARGTVVAVAAGNSNADASGFNPANCVGVITVAATDRTGGRASFSNFGQAVEIAAPGVSLWSTLNDGAQGPANPIYFRYSGTSMATPHVAGVAALMLAANPALTPAQVTLLMQQNAHPFGGGGCPSGCGAGIVDAAKAVAAALPSASGATFVSLPPARVLDTRSGTGLSGPFVSGVARTFQVTGSGGVPVGAVAVTGNLTVTNQTSAGFVALTPVATNNPSTSTLNFPLGDNRANGVTVALGAGGTLSATYAGEAGPSATTALIFDVTGYFVPGTAGATFVSLPPARVLDTRSGTGLSGPFVSGVARTFQVTGSGGVPVGAVAVTGNLTVTQQTSAGFVALTPVATNNPSTSTLNFPLGDNRANGVTVALGAGGTLSATYAGEAGPSATTALIFDVTGYFVPGTAGATFVSLPPARVLDTRSGTGLSGPFVSGVARTFQVTGSGGVPVGAVAVTGNLTVTQQTSAGFVALTPVATNSPSTSTLNFPLGDNRANGVTVALGAGGTLSATYAGEAGPSATTALIFDVTGYFKP